MVDNSVDPSSIAHAEACSAIVERVDMELGASPPPLADCESTSRVFAFGNGDVRDQLRRACQGRDSWRDFFFLPVVERIVADSGIFRIFVG